MNGQIMSNSHINCLNKQWKHTILELDIQGIHNSKMYCYSGNMSGSTIHKLKDGNSSMKCLSRVIGSKHSSTSMVSGTSKVGVCMYFILS